MTAAAAARRVLMVVTRDIPETAESGRERTMAFIRAALAEGGEVETLRLHSVVEQRSLGHMLSILAAAARGLLRGRPLPLQSLLFHDRHSDKLLRDAIDRFHPQTVYFDGVRSGLLLPGLRQSHPRLRLVCDFDDLMSRRMAVLARAGQPISAGYLKRFIPNWVQRHVLDGWLGRTVQSYERGALERVEREIVAAADATVLVSAIEAEHLRKATRSTSVAVIPPVMPNVTPGPWPASVPAPVRRFVFIGSDAMLQNRQSIRFLVDLWKRVQPPLPLHIYGRQTQAWPAVPGIAMHGFVQDVAEAFSPGSVLLAPAFLEGGVKTKVLEAMAHGVVPVGTAATFEGIDADTAAMALPQDAWDAFVLDPARFDATVLAAGRRACEQASAAHAAARLAERWRSVTWPPGAAALSPAGASLARPAA